MLNYGDILGVTVPGKTACQVFFFKVFWEKAILNDILKSLIYAFFFNEKRNASEVISGIQHFYI